MKAHKRANTATSSTAWPIRLRPLPLAIDQFKAGTSDKGTRHLPHWLAHITAAQLHDLITNRPPLCNEHRKRKNTPHMAIARRHCKRCTAIVKYAKSKKLPLTTIKNLQWLHNEEQFERPVNWISDSEARIDQIIDPSPNPQQLLEMKEMACNQPNNIRQLISILPKTQGLMLIDRFNDEMTMEEIGRKHGYTKQNTSLVIKRALKTLRQHLTNHSTPINDKKSDYPIARQKH